MIDMVTFLHSGYDAAGVCMGPFLKKQIEPASIEVDAGW
jgi:hypothetical protein